MFLFDEKAISEYPSYIVIAGALIVLIKDFKDEYMKPKWSLLNNSNLLVRWTTYLALICIIVTQGVLDSGQFIYAKF